MRLNVGWALIACVTIACVPPKPATVWRNAVDPQRNYVRDSQECELLAQALSSSVRSPVYRLLLYNREWERCMIGRDWQEVLADNAPPAPASNTAQPETTPDPRWLQLLADDERTEYIDTSRIDRRSDGVVGIWTSTHYKTPRVVGGVRLKRVLTRYEFDCLNSRLRVTNSAAYDEAGALVNSSQEATQWAAAVPESRGEVMLRGLCPAKAGRNPE